MARHPENQRQPSEFSTFARALALATIALASGCGVTFKNPASLAGGSSALPQLAAGSYVGTVSGGQILTLSGTNFSTSSQVSVTVGGSACAPVTVVSSTQVSCPLPPLSPGSYSVTVTTGPGQSATLANALTVSPPPTFGGISPASGTSSGGTTLTLTGTGFQSGVTVTVGGATCTNLALTGSTTITCVSPNSSSQGNATIVVTNPDTQSVSSTSAFSYGPPLTSASLSTVAASAGHVPSDNTAYVTVIVTPRDPSGNAIGSGKQIEVTLSGGTATMTGTGTSCSSALSGSPCVRAVDAGGGSYTITVKSNTVGSVTLSVVALDAVNGDVALTHTATTSFGSASFTTLSSNTTLTSANAGQNLYITGGTITFDPTTMGQSFGDIIVTGGTIQHTATTNTAVNSLNINVASLNLEGGSISANGLGYLFQHSYGSSGPATALASVSRAGGSHGGRGGYISSPANVGATYDDYHNPTLPGGTNDYGNSGGGVVHIISSGPCIIGSTASIHADAAGWEAAGGTVNLTCSYLAGSAAAGSITANGGTGDGGGCGAGGGRIALISSGDAATFTGSFTYPVSSATLTALKGVVHAYGGSGGSNASGGAGTIYLKHSAQSYGSLIIDNGNTTLTLQAGTTFLVSMAGTVSSTPGASTLPVTVTSSPALAASYANLYAGMRLRPDLSFNNGTPSNWADDNVLTVGANNSTTLTTSATFSGVASGASFRSIDILDGLDVGGGAVLETNGDVYVVNGPLSSPGSSSISLTDAIALFDASGSLNLGLTSTKIANTNMTLASLTLPSPLTVSGSTLNVTNLQGTTLSVTGGTFTGQSVSLSGDFTITGGTVNHPTTTSSAQYAFNATVGGAFTMSGGAVNVTGLGYPVNRAYGPSGPSATLASINRAGGSHGGVGGYMTASTDPTPPYDDYRNPALPGGSNSYGNNGGGVFRLTAAGSCTINNGGTIHADAAGWEAAGGSIYLNCAGFGGTVAAGAISANGGTDDCGGAGAGGGRIALISTANATAWGGNLPFPSSSATLATFKTAVQAYGGGSWCGNPTGGAGTIFVKNSAQTYGSLILDNNNNPIRPQSGVTLLRSLAGTVNAAPSGANMPISTTQGNIGAAYVNLYTGMTVRPNLAFTNGTPSDWTDDNVVTVASNDASSLTMTTNVAGFTANSDSYRTIDIFDEIDIARGAQLRSNGDVYVLNGTISSPGASSLALVDAYETFSGSAGTNLPMASETVTNVNTSFGTYTLAVPLTINNSQTFAATNLTGTSVTVTSGTLTVQSLTLSGDLVLNGGTLNHPTATSTAYYAVNATVGGNFTLSGGSVNVSGLGYPVNRSWSNGGTPSATLASVNRAGGSHGGKGGYTTTGSPSDVGPTYDDYRDPQYPGSSNSYGNNGGGVFRLTATGTCTINSGSAIHADAAGWEAAGGSIYLRCAGFGGTLTSGSITANGGTGDGGGAGAGGGRIALISTGAASSWTGNLPYPSGAANLSSFKSAVHAYGGTGGSHGTGGAGTIFAQNSSESNGDLIIDNGGTAINTWGGKTVLLYTTAGYNNNATSATVTTNPDANTLQLENTGQTPLANLTNLFSNSVVHIWPTSGGSANPADASHISLVLTGNDANDLTSSGNLVPSITNDYYYRFTYKLDHADVGGNAAVDMSGADLWLTACDLHSASTTFDVPAGSSLTGDTISTPTCSTLTTTSGGGETIFFTNYF